MGWYFPVKAIADAGRSPLESLEGKAVLCNKKRDIFERVKIF